MAKQRIHIYSWSRLAFAPVADWVGVLKELESGRKQMYWSYKPLRLGAFRLLKAKGTQQDNIYTYVANLAERAGGPKCRKANMEALRAFEDSFLPDIKAPSANLMEENTRGVDFANDELVGGPHYNVLDRTSERRACYLHPRRR